MQAWGACYAHSACLKQVLFSKSMVQNEQDVRSYCIAMFLSGYQLVILYLQRLSLTQIVSLEYLQRRISKSVPSYLGRPH
jgi:hypothetical protein